ncbi:BTB and MATH domain-containing protein 43 [Orchesella cincta]|uniref:BTB and MATH domain-containing protein 43 n=1 Tax=Orchesella cincta TaxID=48709 RepID=A0A1D2M880_ORCCI|nr:BTB and MATH domain-containing protein 43 [Orchesella cincta]
MFVEKDPFSFLWVVNNFSSLNKLAEVKSPVFRGGHKNNYGQLSMNPSNKFDNVEYCSFYVSLVTMEKGKTAAGPVRATFQISLLNADGRPVVETGGCRLSISAFFYQFVCMFPFCFSQQQRRHLENLKIPDVCGAAKNLLHVHHSSIQQGGWW